MKPEDCSFEPLPDFIEYCRTTINRINDALSKWSAFETHKTFYLDQNESYSYSTNFIIHFQKEGWSVQIMPNPLYGISRYDISPCVLVFTRPEGK